MGFPTVTHMCIYGPMSWNVLARGLRAMCYQKDPTFLRSLSPKDPHFYQLSPNDPLFLTNSLSPKDPDTSLSLKDPSFLHNDKFDEMLRIFFGHFGPESPLFFDAFHWKTPYFCVLCHWKTPPFWRNLSPKDPYIWGAWWHSYVTFICECPPPRRVWPQHCLNNGKNKFYSWINFFFRKSTTKQQQRKHLGFN